MHAGDKPDDAQNRAQMIGYSTSSRFAELFKKSTGILPIEYRRLARRA